MSGEGNSHREKNKTISVLKKVGKGLFKSAKFIAESAPKVIKEVARQHMDHSEKALKRTDLSDDDREKLTKLNNQSHELYQTLKDREKNRYFFSYLK